MSGLTAAPFYGTFGGDSSSQQRRQRSLVLLAVAAVLMFVLAVAAVMLVQEETTTTLLLSLPGSAVTTTTTTRSNIRRSSFLAKDLLSFRISQKYQKHRAHSNDNDDNKFVYDDNVNDYFDGGGDDDEDDLDGLLSDGGEDKEDHHLSKGHVSRANLDKLVSMLPDRISQLVDTNADPCVDFHAFACGKWEKSHAVSEDNTVSTFAFGLDTGITMRNIARMFGLDVDSSDEDDITVMEAGPPIPPPPLPTPKPLQDYFDACADVDLIEKLGVTTIQPMLDTIRNISDSASLAHVVAGLHRLSVGIFFEWVVIPDHAKPQRNQLYIKPGGLGLPSAHFYAPSNGTAAEGAPLTPAERKSIAYLELVGKLAVLAGTNTDDGDDDGMLMANGTWVVESALAHGVGLKGPDGKAAKMVQCERAYLVSTYPHFDWNSYFAAWNASDIGVDGSMQLVVASPPWLQNMDNMFATTPLSTIKAYLLSRTVHHFAALLPHRFLQANLEFENVMTGQRAMYPRWEKCSYAVRTALPFMLSKTYIGNYISEPTKRVATAMMEDIRLAFEHQVKLTQWMSNDTRVAAIDKLQKMVVEVAYPDNWDRYLETDVVVHRHTYAYNYMRAMHHKNDRLWGLLRLPVYRPFWYHIPIIANAYYSSGTNAAFLPVGLLQDPFYNLDLPAAYNFGAVGSIIGHELTHGFDNNGHHFDASGKRRAWWDKKTLQMYSQRANCFADLYDSFSINGVHVNGHATLGEDIADVGGLKTAYKAFLLAAKLYSPRKPKITDRQLFWLSYASTRCGVERLEHELLSMATSEVHPPRQFRLVGPVSQLKEFARDFKCPAGSPMNPVHKCELW